MVLLPKVTFRIASAAERAEAVRLRSQIYKEELGHHGVDEFDDKADHLIAVDSLGEIIAAIRILGPEQRPLEIEKFVDLRRIIGRNRRVAQIGGFWIRAVDRRVQSRSFLPLWMLKVSFTFARKRGITDFVMRTHLEELRRFYERGFFRLVEELGFNHPNWGLVYVMHLDLESIETHHRESKDPIARFLLSDDASRLASIEV